MECMKRLAEQGRIIISSIHQPRAAIWDLFTKVQVLSEGRSLYFGPIHEVRLTNEMACIQQVTGRWCVSCLPISHANPPLSWGEMPA